MTTKGRAPLTGICGSRGDHMSKADILHAIQGPHGEPVVDFACLYEMASEGATVHALKAMPQWIVVEGHNNANILVLNAQTMRFQSRLQYPLLGEATRMGIHNQAKDAIGAIVTHLPSRRAMELYTMHNIQSLWMPGRREPGRIHNDKFVREVTPHKRLAIAGMDANAEPGDPSMKPFRDHNWDLVFPFGTFKKPKYKRNIDGFAVDDRDKPAGPILHDIYRAQKVEVQGTDHLWVKVTWQVLVRIP